MKLITPVPVTDAMLTSSNLPETDAPAWSAGTVYSVGQTVIRTGTHRIYRRLLAGSSPTAPELDPTNWQDIGPTNRWAPFDSAVGSLATTAGTSITYTLTPGQTITSIALLDLDADGVLVSVSVSGSTVYSRTWAPAVSPTSMGSWFSYFFDPFERRGSLVILDLPAYPTAVISITLTGTAPLAVGTIVIGTAYDLGTTLTGTKVGITDYSVKNTDEFGVTTLVERSYAKRMETQLVVPTGQASTVARRLAAARATPAIWIGEQDIDAAIVYGWPRDWAIELSYPQVSYISLSIDGLV